MINSIPPGDQKRIHIIGRAQGYLGLAVHFGVATDGPSGLPTPELRTAWEPTARELAALNAGGKVVIELINIKSLTNIENHPPIKVYVSDPPERV
jgi:hypothetical protein